MTLQTTFHQQKPFGSRGGFILMFVYMPEGLCVLMVHELWGGGCSADHFRLDKYPSMV